MLFIKCKGICFTFKNVKPMLKVFKKSYKMSAFVGRRTDSSGCKMVVIALVCNIEHGYHYHHPLNLTLDGF